MVLHWNRVGLKNLVDDRCVGVSFERFAVGEQLVKEYTEGKDVRAVIEVGAFDLFR